MPPISTSPSGPPPKRRLRNLLLDTRFQLKYTGMVVSVTVAVATVLGYFAFDYSQGQTRMLSMQLQDTPSFNPEAMAFIEQEAQAEDRKVLTGIIAGILILTFAIGCTGIVVTHRLVGPAYKLKRMFGLVSKGHFKVQGKLRRGDELQDVFDSFAAMVEALRKRQLVHLDSLEKAIESARAAGVSDAALVDVIALRQAMGAGHEDPTMRL